MSRLWIRQINPVTSAIPLHFYKQNRRGTATLKKWHWAFKSFVFCFVHRRKVLIEHLVFELEWLGLRCVLFPWRYHILLGYRVSSSQKHFYKLLWTCFGTDLFKKKKKKTTPSIHSDVLLLEMSKLALNL